MCDQRFNCSDEVVEITNATYLQCHFPSSIDIFKIGSLYCKSVTVLKESILRSSKVQILGEKLSFVLLFKNLSTPRPYI